MRILHLSSVYAPDAMGGAERVVEMLAVGSSARPGVEVAVAHIAPQPRPPAKRQGVDIFPLAHRNPLWITDSAKYPSPVRNLNKIATLFNLLSAGDLARLLKQYQPDIVHSHSMVELPPRVWAVAKRAGAAVVHTLHDYDLLCIRAALFKDGQRCVQRHTSCAAFSRVKRWHHTSIQSVVGVSKAILQTHLDDGLFAHVPDESRHVVWNPVPLAPLTPLPPTTARHGPLVFGFMGRLVAEKGIHTLLEACRRVGRTGWTLKIAGRAPKHDPSLQALAQGLPIEFAGFVDPAAFLREIDVLVVPSIWLEPFGLTIIEAYAAGVPVIGADIAGVAELLRSVGAAAALVPPGDPAALADALRRTVAAGRGALRPPDTSVLLQRTQTAFVVDRYLDVYRAALGASEAQPH